MHASKPVPAADAWQHVVLELRLRIVHQRTKRKALWTKEIPTAFRGGRNMAIFVFDVVY